MNVKELIAGAVKEAILRAIEAGKLPQIELPAVMLEVPPQKNFGDFATNFAMQLARAAKTNPKVIAETIVTRLSERANLDKNDPAAISWLDKAEIAGPGFINFYLTPIWLYEMLAEILASGEDFGKTTTGRNEKIQVEFVSANPTGPLHVGHGRGAAVGSALANLLSVAGYDVADGILHKRCR